MKKMGRRAQRKSRDGVVVGIAWYTPDGWARLKQIAADADEMDSSFDEWQAGVEKAVANFARSGVSARKVYVDVDVLDAWCRSRCCPNTRGQRANFVAHKLAEQGEGEQAH